jgi:hypothetical protein
MSGLSTGTAVAVAVLVTAAVVALTLRDEAAITRRDPLPRRSRLIAAAWPLTIAALLAAAARILVLY